MKLAKLVVPPLRYQPWNELNLRLIAEDIASFASEQPCSHRVQMKAALDYLCRSLDVRARQSDFIADAAALAPPARERLGTGAASTGASLSTLPGDYQCWSDHA